MPGLPDPGQHAHLGNDRSVQDKDRGKHGDWSVQDKDRGKPASLGNDCSVSESRGLGALVLGVEGLGHHSSCFIHELSLPSCKKIDPSERANSFSLMSFSGGLGRGQDSRLAT